MSSTVLDRPPTRHLTAAPAPSRVATGPGPARRTGAAVLSLAALGAIVLLGRAWRGRGQAVRAAPRVAVDEPELRSLHAAAAALAASVLVDSAIEHERARFENPGMWTPLLVASAALLAGLGGARRPAASPSGLPARSGAYAMAGLAGGAGFGFHAWNLHRQPGGLSRLNLYYAAPLGAPAALLLSGALGSAAQRLAAPGPVPPRLLGLPPGRALCALVAAGLAGTVGEVALLHDRGAWHHPFMWLPVSLPPVAALLVARAAIAPPRPGTAPATRTARAWLRLTAALGVAGAVMHAVGVSRAMGGWRNWRQNVPDGPPLPAPPAFSALSLAGLAALRLRSRDAAPVRGGRERP